MLLVQSMHNQWDVLQFADLCTVLLYIVLKFQPTYMFIGQLDQTLSYQLYTHVLWIM